MAKIEYVYMVWEHYADQPSEPFGEVVIDHRPEPGETIQLYWLDGKPAYKVKVNYVDHAKMEIHVGG